MNVKYSKYLNVYNLVPEIVQILRNTPKGVWTCLRLLFLHESYVQNGRRWARARKA